jgi:hypothetical protein
MQKAYEILMHKIHIIIANVSVYKKWELRLECVSECDILGNVAHCSYTRTNIQQ